MHTYISLDSNEMNSSDTNAMNDLMSRPGPRGMRHLPGPQIVIPKARISTAIVSKIYCIK